MEITNELIISLSLNLILFIIIIFLMVSISKIKKRIRKFLPENKEFNIEQMLTDYNKNVLDIIQKQKDLLEKINNNKSEFESNLNISKEELQTTINNNKQELQNNINNNKQELQNNINNTNIRLDETKHQLKSAIQKVGFIRYNPFPDVGGELCYAIALLDENNNGVIINSIYARETCYSYAKDITNGESLNHKLSDEEIQALKMAINS